MYIIAHKFHTNPFIPLIISYFILQTLFNLNIHKMTLLVEVLFCPGTETELENINIYSAKQFWKWYNLGFSKGMKYYFWKNRFKKNFALNLSELLGGSVPVWHVNESEFWFHQKYKFREIKLKTSPNFQNANYIRAFYKNVENAN